MLKFVKFVAIRKAVLIVYVMTTKQTMKRFEYFLGSFAPFRSFGWNVPGTTTHQSTTKKQKPGKKDFRYTIESEILKIES